MKRISFAAVLFVGVLISMTATVWVASARALWVPSADEQSDLSLRDVESNSRRSVYNRWNRYGK